MKLSGRTDIQAPTAFVFDMLSDFDYWERAAMRRGADVHRTDKQKTIGPGMSWMLRFGWRGRERQLHMKLTALDRPNQISFAGDGPSVILGINCEIVELSAKRCRIIVQSELKPRTLAARLFIQSMKLARGKVMKRYETRLKNAADLIEARYIESLRG
ncbi:MAG: hypothetical protein RIR62_2415 [Pseudomonadota bacterium]|jgi:carbon monoxide dehydrogenase subunit G